MTNYEKSQERQTAFPEVADAIAAVIGGDTPMDPGTEWHFEKTNDCAGVLRRSPDGLELTLWLDSYGGRVEVKPRPPAVAGKGQPVMSLRDYGVTDYNANTLATSFAFKRDPKQAAGQITRVVLVPYEPLYLQVLERKAEIERKHKDAFDLYRDLLFALGKHPPTVDEGPGQDHQINLYQSGGYYGDITVSSHGSVEIKLRSLTGKQARTVVALLAKMRAEPAKKKPAKP